VKVPHVVHDAFERFTSVDVKFSESVSVWIPACSHRYSSLVDEIGVGEVCCATERKLELTILSKFVADSVEQV
jgi:hypothetical protein